MDVTETENQTQITAEEQKLSEPGQQSEAETKSLLEPVDVVAGEIFCLLDYPVAHDSAAKSAELRIEALYFVRRERSDLVEAMEAERLKRILEFRPDAFHQAEVVALPGAAAGAGIVRARRRPPPG